MTPPALARKDDPDVTRRIEKIIEDDSEHVDAVILKVRRAAQRHRDVRTVRKSEDKK